MIASVQFSSVGGLDFLLRHSGTALTALELDWPLNLSAALRGTAVTTAGYSKCYLKISHNQNI